VFDEDIKALPEIVSVTDTAHLPKIEKGRKITFVYGENANFYDGKKEYFIKLKTNFFDEGVSAEEFFGHMKPYLEDKDNEFIVYGKKDLMHQLDDFGITLKAFCDDVSLEKYVLEQEPSEKFGDFITFNGVSDKYPAFSLFVLHNKYVGELKAQSVYDLYYNIELPLVQVLYDMENAGFKIDADMLDDMSKEYAERVENIYNKIIDAAGEKFNPNSSPQLARILFEKLNLKSGKKTKRGYSTDAEVLESLEDEHEIIPLILKYRQLQKLYSTYIEGFKNQINRKTGLVHTTFYQTFTTTGRLSSREPNLQNIPVRDAEGKEIRKLFVSSFPGGKLVGADYSQIELRLLAHFSGCKPLIDAYNNDEDIQSLTASQEFGVTLDEVTGEMRRSAKAVNFGIIYGISDFGLSRQLKISPKRAGEYIKRYFEMYPSVKEYMDLNVEFARKNGYVCTLFGRKRYIKEINSTNFNMRSFGERAAMNMPLQGTAADIIKIAMNGVAAALKRANAKSKLILQVHDELLVDTTEDEIEFIKGILIENMQSAATLKVPLIAEIECGTRWFDAK
ncbi:MAG: DNA polymerase I, partial [Clostridia bacterium]|nr:DNA polymerase I [Clostridia bacterium]